MFSIRRLALMGICRAKCPRLSKISGSDRFAPQLRNVLESQIPNGIARRNFCRRTSENQNVYENEDDELRMYQGEDAVSYEEEEEEEGEEKKQKKAEIFEEISKGDPAILKSLKLLDLEIAFLKSQRWRVPDYLSKAHWEELLQKKSLSQRRKFLAFLRLNEFKQQHEKQKSALRRQLAMKEKEEAGFHFYGLSGHTMFMRIYEKPLNRLLDLRQQVQLGMKIILDCSYEEYMSDLNLKACAKQISLCTYVARYHRQPCQISICNLQEDGQLARLIPRFSPRFFEVLGSNHVKGDMLDCFPREKLVYLTPDSSNTLDFNADDIYIIGAFVDKGTGTKVSSAKARTSQIRHAKLPIDSYVYWKQGTKSLTLDAVLKILLDMGFYNDWNKAFSHLPRRCIKDPSQTVQSKHQEQHALYKISKSS